MRVKYIFAYAIAFILGGTFSCLNSKLSQRFWTKDSLAWTNHGMVQQPIPFREDSDSLLKCDQTIMESDTALISTPELAGEIATSIFEDYFNLPSVQKKYPFEIYKDIYSWDIEGTCLNVDEDKNTIYFDLVKHIYINRKDGMVMSISH